MQETWVSSPCWEDAWRREWLPTTVFLPGEFYGQRTLVALDYSPWGCKELDTIERPVLSLSHIHSTLVVDMSVGEAGVEWWLYSHSTSSNHSWEGHRPSDLSVCTPQPLVPSVRKGHLHGHASSTRTKVIILFLSLCQCIYYSVSFLSF